MADAMVGKKRLSELTWVLSEKSNPFDVGERLLEDTRVWLERVTFRSSNVLPSETSAQG